MFAGLVGIGLLAYTQLSCSSSDHDMRSNTNCENRSCKLGSGTVEIRITNLSASLSMSSWVLRANLHDKYKHRHIVQLLFLCLYCQLLNFIGLKIKF